MDRILVILGLALSLANLVPAFAAKNTKSKIIGVTIAALLIGVIRNSALVVIGLCLALGKAQLEYKSFELSVLELYRNDPRYSYEYDDIHGYISIRDELYGKSKMKASDEILLESFGVSFDDEDNVYVAVFLRYLSRLSPEHQLIWGPKGTSLTK